MLLRPCERGVWQFYCVFAFLIRLLLNWILVRWGPMKSFRAYLPLHYKSNTVVSYGFVLIPLCVCGQWSQTAWPQIAHCLCTADASCKMSKAHATIRFLAWSLYYNQFQKKNTLKHIVKHTQILVDHFACQSDSHFLCNRVALEQIN